MKRIFKNCAFLIALFIFFFSGKDGNKSPFEGIVTYTLSQKGTDGAMDLPKTLVFYVKDSMLRQVENDDMGCLINIVNSKEPWKHITLKEFLGFRFCEDFPKEGEAKTKHYYDSISTCTDIIIYTNETKVIMGYTCKKLYIKYSGKALNRKAPIFSPVYYTEEIKAPNFYLPLPGLAMQENFFYSDSNSVYTVTSIVKKDLPDSLFKVTPSYRHISNKDFPRIMDSLMRGK